MTGTGGCTGAGSGAWWRDTTKSPMRRRESGPPRSRVSGASPLTYFQPGVRSEDYARAFPGHMLYDQARKYILRNGKIVKHGHPLIGAGTIRNHSDPAHPLRGYGKDWAENYDYTDKGFQAHLARVYDNLRAGGVEGDLFRLPLLRLSPPGRPGGPVCHGLQGLQQRLPDSPGEAGAPGLPAGAPGGGDRTALSPT